MNLSSNLKSNTATAFPEHKNGHKNYPNHLRMPGTGRDQRADRAMIRWICGVRLRDEIPTVDLLARLGLEEITSALRARRLRWHGHVARSSGSI